MKLKLLLLASFVLNLAFASFVFYKWRNKYFEPMVFKLPFRQSVFSGASNKPGLIYFLGDSHTEGFELNEYLNNSLVRNRGVWGDLSASLKNRIGDVIKTKPKEVFIMIGVNDVIQGNNPESVTDNLNDILRDIKAVSPTTIVYLESVLPTNKSVVNSTESAYNKIIALNKDIEALAKEQNVKFLNLFPYFTDGKELRPDYSFDGFDLNGKGYNKLAQLLKPQLVK